MTDNQGYCRFKWTFYYANLEELPAEKMAAGPTLMVTLSYGMSPSHTHTLTHPHTQTG